MVWTDMSGKLHRHKAYAHKAFMITLCYIYIFQWYHLFLYLAPQSSSFWMSSVWKWCTLYIVLLSFLSAQLGGHNTSGWKSRQITEWSTWPLRGHIDRWPNGVQRSRVSTSRLTTLKDWLPFFYFDPRRRIKCCQCQPPGVCVSLGFILKHVDFYIFTILAPYELYIMLELISIVLLSSTLILGFHKPQDKEIWF